MNKTNDVDPVERLVTPSEVYCPACGVYAKTEGPITKFAVFVGCSRCHRLIRVLYSDGDVSEVTA